MDEPFQGYPHLLDEETGKFPCSTAFGLCLYYTGTMWPIGIGSKGLGYSDFNYGESNVMSFSGPADSVKLVFQKHLFSRSLIALDGRERSIRARGLYCSPPSTTEVAVKVFRPQ